MDIPIIIYHIGYQEYITLCLKQALKHNKNVILITNETRKYSIVNGATIIDAADYNNGSKLFKNLFVNWSRNAAHIEFLCIVRWFSVCQYMHENNIERAFICDSDVLIYENITKIDKEYLKDNEFMLCSSLSKNLTGSQSIWNLSKLKEFTYFVFNFYKTQSNKINTWYKNYKEPGGICDMTLLYYFSHKETEFKGLRLPNFPYFNNDLTQIFDNEFTFDCNLDQPGNHIHPDEWEINDRNSKNIKYIDGKPYCYNKRLNKDIKFVLLHFQGRNKNIMKDYYLKTN